MGPFLVIPMCQKIRQEHDDSVYAMVKDDDGMSDSFCNAHSNEHVIFEVCKAVQDTHNDL
jgi:hypothetical protein